MPGGVNRRRWPATLRCLPRWWRRWAAFRAAARSVPAPLELSAPAAWPALTSSARPWAIWWWPGSAVEERELEAHLARYAAAGLGGVHVVPIYGVRGAEERALPFLSAAWVDRLRFTVRAARARGTGRRRVDRHGLAFRRARRRGGGWIAAGHRRAVHAGAERRLDQPVQARGAPEPRCGR